MYKKSRIDNYLKLFQLNKYLKDHEGAFIAGGCFKDIFLNKPVRDIDVFFRNEKQFKSLVKKYKKDKDFKFKYENDNCIGFTSKNGVDVELVRSIFGEPPHILNNFDFSIVKFALIYNEKDVNSVLFDENFWEHLSLKRLVIKEDLPKPVATFNRVLKYARYGFALCKESKSILLSQVITRGDVNNLNLELYGGWD